MNGIQLIKASQNRDVFFLCLKRLKFACQPFLPYNLFKDNRDNATVKTKKEWVLSTESPE